MLPVNRGSGRRSAYDGAHRETEVIRRSPPRSGKSAGSTVAVADDGHELVDALLGARDVMHKSVVWQRGDVVLRTEGCDPPGHEVRA
jgi:hypothetical protein